jgi:hypothetical protein
MSSPGEGVKQMKCGGCGGEDFKVFTEDPAEAIMVVCMKCKSVSTIKPKAQLEVEWEADGNNGCLCIMG